MNEGLWPLDFPGGEKFTGLVKMHPEEQHFLFDTCEGKETYLEVGTAYGGSAVIAGLAGCKVTTVDIQMGPLWENGPMGVDVVRLNFKRFGVEGVIIKANSMEFDFSGYKSDVAFIDGNHSTAYVVNDWEKVSQVSDIVLFHDHNKHYNTVLEAITLIDFTGWTHHQGVGSIYVAKRSNR